MGGLSKSRSCFALLPDDDTVSTPASHHHHHHHHHHNFGELEPTSLFISGNEGEPEQRLYLPRSGTAPCSLDEYLCSIPRVASRACDLFNNDNNVCNSSSTDYEHNNHNTNTTTTALNTTTTRCLNVLQGEVAHASSLQTDVVVSAEATTCHIVALRSTTSASVPVVSLAHVDQAYDSCLEAMVQEHIRHHQLHKNNSSTTTTRRADSQVLEEQHSDEYGYFWDDDDEPTEYLEQVKGHPSDDEDDHYHELIEMELHMLGGFLDKDGTSQELSTSLVTTFSYLAKKYRDKVRISLSTAAISCMNSSSSASTTADTTTTMPAAPKGRGLGIDIRTGKVFSVKTTLPAHLEGPALEVRLARAWARASIKGEKKAALSVIHDTKSEHGHLRIEPFLYEPLETLNALLQVPDDVLLHYTSTSPECESAQFCGQLRRTLSFLNTVPKENVFGKDCKSTLVYSRSAGNLNEWEQVVVPQATKQQRI
jgi:hypothetical protein